MEPSLLMWGFFTFTMIPGCMAGACVQQPPSLRNATFKILGYKVGTTLNCDCQRGFRRDPSSGPYMICRGNSSHSFWENKCQCMPTSSPRIPVKQVTPRPEEQKERKTTETQGQMQPPNQANLPGHCKEPPPWEHESLKRVYHFMEGQTVQYQCLPGFRDGSAQNNSAQSVCKKQEDQEVMRWTQLKLKCKSEKENGSFPEPQINTAAPPMTKTSLPTRTKGTTDSQNLTEVPATMQPIIFTTQYQLAVAGCVLLLLSILLLSGLTWQRRRKKNRRTI